MSTIVVRTLNRLQLTVSIEGTSSLITDRFRAKGEIDDGSDAGYHLADGRYGVPATAFKGAIAEAVQYHRDPKPTPVILKEAIFVRGEGSEMLVPIEAPAPNLREDIIRGGPRGRVVARRIRPEFWPWRAELIIVFKPSTLTVGSLLSLVDVAGVGGIGLWRPKNGSFRVVEGSADVGEVMP